MSMLTMSFVKAPTNGDAGIRNWCIEETGDWARDNATGRAAADELLLYIKTNDAPNALAHVVEAMVQGRRFGGVEIGFMTRIAAAASR